MDMLTPCGYQTMKDYAVAQTVPFNGPTKEPTNSKLAISGFPVSKHFSQHLTKTKVFVPMYIISEWT